MRMVFVPPGASRNLGGKGTHGEEEEKHGQGHLALPPSLFKEYFFLKLIELCILSCNFKKKKLQHSILLNGCTLAYLARSLLLDAYGVFIFLYYYLHWCDEHPSCSLSANILNLQDIFLQVELLLQMICTFKKGFNMYCRISLYKDCNFYLIRSVVFGSCCHMFEYPQWQKNLHPLRAFYFLFIYFFTPIEKVTFLH